MLAILRQRGQVFTPMIFALALIEFQAIMGFIIAYLWLGSKRLLVWSLR